MRKIITGGMVLLLCANCGLSVCAVDDMATQTPQVYSAAYPDAYIITAYDNNIFSRSGDVEQTVSATVFVEETYSLDENDTVIVTSSRLLSEEEVYEVGIENFGDFIGARAEAVGRTSDLNQDTNARGKLDITFSERHSLVGNGVNCEVSATAEWSSGPNVLYGSTRPASGYDYMGIVWYGGFSGDLEIEGVCSQEALSSFTVNDTETSPNTGVVYEFEEAWSEYVMGSSTNIYATEVNIDGTLSKNTLEGNGNTAQIVLQYIHTYDTLDGKISFNFEWDSEEVLDIDLGFTLDNVQAQWGIECVLSGVPY